jgi:hypothetical protein
LEKKNIAKIHQNPYDFCVHKTSVKLKIILKFWAFVQLKTFRHEKIVYTPQECMIFTPTNLQIFFWVLIFFTPGVLIVFLTL